MKQAAELFPELLHVDREVDINKYRSQYFSGCTHPVLERILDEILDGKYQSPFIPNIDHHIRQGYFLHAPPLTLYNDNVINPDGLRKGDLKTSQQITERLLRGKTNDNTAYSHSGKQACPYFPHAFKAQKDDGNGNQHDNSHQ